MSEENTPQEEVQQEEAQQEDVQQEENSQDIVEVSWEELKSLFEIREALRDIDTRFSELLLNYEKQKAAFLARSQELETFLYEEGTNLRGKLNVDATVAYELKLPANKGEKGYFIRKG